MITQEEKEQFLKEFDRLIKSDFTPFDVACFIKYNDLAKELLRKYDCCDYNVALDTLYSLDESIIKEKLDVSHLDYFNTLFGSKDPMIAFCVSKDDLGDCKTYDDIHECDNILSHLLDQLGEESIEINLNDVLSRENLEKLTYGEIDVPAAQIYYFEKKGEQGEFYFEHCYRNGGGWDCDAFSEYDINNFDREIEIDEYDNWKDAFNAYIDYFANKYKYYCKGSPDTLDKEVYNGEEAVAELRATFEPVFEEVWKRKLQEVFGNIDKEAEIERNRLYFLLKDYPQILALSIFRDKEYFDLSFGSAGAGTLRAVFSIIKNLAYEIEKKDMCIEQYKEENERLKAYLQLERAKQALEKAKSVTKPKGDEDA